MKHVLIPVSAIHPNPHRNFKRNPIQEDQVAKLLESIRDTGFWDNVIVRPHPGKKGEYQLAYGHNRLEAVKREGITEVRLPVADLNDWKMYQAMVWENESQRDIPPKIAAENIEVGIGLLESAFKEIGPEGTEEEFNRALGRRTSVPAGTEVPSKHAGGFEMVRNAFFKEEGIGRKYVEVILPCGHLRKDTISTILNSHYGAKREAAKQKAADAQHKAAAAKRAKAQAAKDEAEARQLEQEAAAADAEAEALAAEAKRIGGRAVAMEILLGFDTTRQMTDFAAAVQAAGVAKEHHKAAMEHVKDKEAFGKKMAETVALWWYEFSGQGRKDRARQAKEQAFKAFQRHVKGGDIKDYFLAISDKIKDLTADIRRAQGVARYAEPERLRKALATQLLALIEQAQLMADNLSEEVIDAEATEVGGSDNGSKPRRLLN